MKKEEQAKEMWGSYEDYQANVERKGMYEDMVDAYPPESEGDE